MPTALFYRGTEKPVSIGDVAVTFRGEQVIVCGIERPRHAGSTGRVYVSYVVDGVANPNEMNEYYPGVINAEWRIVLAPDLCKCCGHPLTDNHCKTAWCTAEGVKA